MRFGMPALAGFLLVALGAAAPAQDLRGPREPPPAGFAGQQYVDSGGCVFLRAGIGGRVTWVPRVTRERRQLCGQTPSFTPAPVAAAAAQPESPAARPAPAPRPARRATMPQRAAPGTVAGAPATAAPRPLAPHAAATARATGAPAAAARIIGCPRATPVARRYALRDGGSVVLCVPPDGDIDLAQAPVLPRGYRLAWSDGRLNALRGIGTPEGQAAQDRVWTREVPARPAAMPAPAQPASPSPGPAVAPAAGAPRHWVQVGSFAQPQNATAARARIAAAGLPVATGRGAIRGRPVEIVHAGPFATAAEAAGALRVARSAGFGDAFLR